METFIPLRRTVAVVLMLMLAAGLWTAWPQAVLAAPDEGIAVRANAGLEGVVKDNRWTRLRFHVTNKTARQISGELRLTMLQPNRGYFQQYNVEAELPPGSPVVIEMTVPGTSFSKFNNHIAFTQAGGKKVPITEGADYVEANATSDTLIGVVARDSDTLNFMPLLNRQGYQFRVLPLSADELPHKMLQLNGLDFLLLNDVASADLSREQVRAIRGWVQQGGALIVAGGAGYGKTAQAFADIVPVAPGGTAELSSLDAFAAWGEGKPLADSGPVTVSTGELQAGRVLLADSGLIVAASRAYGNGHVIYAAFDPSLAPFADWAGSAALWSRIIDPALSPAMNQAAGAMFGISNRYWEMNNAIKQFPSISQPPFGMLLLFFIIYVLVVGPLLFLVLRKFDRREWAWWLLPIVSVVSSIAIYSFGSSGKSDTLAHSLRVVELAGNGEAIRSADFGVFSPRGGTVTAAFEADATVVPYLEYGFSGNVSLDVFEASIAERKTATSTESIWRDVPYGSLRHGWLQYEPVQGMGQLAVNVQYSQAQTIGIEVRNETQVDLSSVTVLAGNSAYLVGDLAVGAAGTVSVPVASVNVPHMGWYDYGGSVFPYTGGPDEHGRERSMLNGFMNNQDRVAIGRPPVVVGFSKDEDSWFTIGGKQAHTDNLTLWMQPLYLEELLGEGVIVPGAVAPVITKQDMDSVGYSGDSSRLILTDGSLEFEYRLPMLADGIAGPAAGGVLTVYPGQIYGSAAVELAIWNVASGKWETLDSTPGAVRPAEAAGSYVSDQNTVRMKLEFRGQAEYALPAIGWEGKVNAR